MESIAPAIAFAPTHDGLISLFTYIFSKLLLFFLKKMF